MNHCWRFFPLFPRLLPLDPELLLDDTWFLVEIRLLESVSVPEAWVVVDANFLSILSFLLFNFFYAGLTILRIWPLLTIDSSWRTVGNGFTTRIPAGMCCYCSGLRIHVSKCYNKKICDEDSHNKENSGKNLQFFLGIVWLFCLTISISRVISDDFDVFDARVLPFPAI